MKKKGRESRIRKAMRHRDKLGAGAAARRRHLRSGSEKAEAVMREYHRGTLHSGSGEKVKNEAQAKAIASSEARRKKRHARKR